MQDIDSWSVAGAKAVVRMACALIRDVLVQFNGYEVRENSGNFLLSFGCPEDALRFCIAAQKAFMHVRAPTQFPGVPIHNANRGSAWLGMTLDNVPSAPFSKCSTHLPGEPALMQ